MFYLKLQILWAIQYALKSRATSLYFVTEMWGKQIFKWVKTSWGSLSFFSGCLRQTNADTNFFLNPCSCFRKRSCQERVDWLLWAKWTGTVQLICLNELARVSDSHLLLLCCWFCEGGARERAFPFKSQRGTSDAQQHSHAIPAYSTHKIDFNQKHAMLAPPKQHRRTLSSTF